MSKALLDALTVDHHVEVVDFSKQGFKEGVDSLKRVFEIIKILKKIWHKKKNVDAIYLTISESFAGNIKDLFIYLICFRYLSKIYIHLHGGSIKRLLWDRYEPLLKVNRAFIKKFAGVIISGHAHINIFDTLIPLPKIHIVPNFAPDYLFLTEKDIKKKFSRIPPLRILYISNFIPKKGYNELVDAFLSMNNDLKNNVRIEFAGRFDSESLRKTFLEKIAGFRQMTYHGVVDDIQKKRLFSQCHIFCLPTAFFEGQPISILEAYASGCVVLTTGKSGICDIFTHGRNGFEIQEKSANSIKLSIENIFDTPESLIQIAITNRRLASQKYKMSTYTSALENIIEGSGVGVSE